MVNDKLNNNALHVVAAVIYNAENTHILIAKRPANKHQGGKWEFPGGKVEAEESAQEALQRELYEELDISISDATAFTQVSFQYPDKSVFLDVYEVKQFSGTAIGKEGQKVRWVLKEELDTFDFPEANITIIKAIKSSM